MSPLEHREQGPNEPLTSELLADVMFGSYFHSQGNVPLQKLILEYVAHQRPQWKQALAHVSIQPAVDKARSFLKGKGAHKPMDISGEDGEDLVGSNVLREWGVFQQAFSAEAPQKDAVRNILAGMLERDATFLLEQYPRESIWQKQGGGVKGIRPHSPEAHKLKQEGAYDRRKGQFVSFVLKGERFGPREPRVFQEMFADMKQALEREPGALDDAHRKIAEGLLYFHNQTYPDAQVSVPYLHAQEYTSDPDEGMVESPLP